MILYLVIFTLLLGVIAMIILSDCYNAFDSFLVILSTIGVWGLLAVCPANTHTEKTKVELLDPSFYKIMKINPHYSVLITEMGEDVPYVQKIDNSYILWKIENKQFKVLKHTHLNVLDSECCKTTYFIKGI